MPKLSVVVITLIIKGQVGFSNFPEMNQKNHQKQLFKKQCTKHQHSQQNTYNSRKAHLCENDFKQPGSQGGEGSTQGPSAGLHTCHLTVLKVGLPQCHRETLRLRFLAEVTKAGKVSAQGLQGGRCVGGTDQPPHLVKRIPT